MLSAEPLAQRVFLGERADLRRDGVVTAEGQVGINPQFHRREAEFLEAADLALQGLYV